jgi:hypothetical protein
MSKVVNSLMVLAAGALLSTNGIAQSAQQVRGPSPFIPVAEEAAPKLIVDAPIAAALVRGAVQIQYRTENVRIVPVFGAAALDVSPRIGHLHITVDDLPWHWADASDSGIIDIVGMPAGVHKVLVELVDAAHHLFPGQAVTVAFTVPHQER